MDLKPPASMTTIELTPALLSLGFLLLLMLIKNAFRPSKSLNLPPGPWKLPIIGSLHHLVSALPQHALRRLAQRHGPVMLLRLGQVDMLVVSTPETASEIMKSQDLNFCSRPEFHIARVLTYGFTNIVFAPYGDYWRQLRKICTVELLSPKRVRSFHSIFEQEISKLITDINNASPSETKPVNLSGMLMGLTNTIIARCAFGNNSEDQLKFISTAKEVLELVSGFSVVDLFPRIKFIDVLSGTRSRIHRIHRQLDEILEGIMKEHQLKQGKQEGEVEDLVDVLLRIKDHGEIEFPLTNNNLKAVIMDIFIAGSESTATVVAWAMSELIKKPEKMAKAQAEVRRVLNGKTKIEDSDLEELHYIKMVIKETLRLHPPAPLLVPRQVIDDCKVDDYNIPAGTRVIVNAWAIGRDPRYWEDADNFKPERFSDSSVDFRGVNFEFVPFGAGRRICPGMTFGVTTVGFMLPRLLYHFDWALPDGMKPEELNMDESFGSAASRKTDLCLLATPYSPCALGT